MKSVIKRGSVNKESIKGVGANKESFSLQNPPL